VNESPISSESSYQWESATLSDVPRFYHHIVNSNSNVQVNCESETIFNENICPRSLNVAMPSRPVLVLSSSMISESARSSGVCFSQTKITGEWDLKKNVIMQCY
jgi:hypothetical protein